MFLVLSLQPESLPLTTPLVTTMSTKRKLDDVSDEDDTPLAKSMKEASDALKALRKLEKDDWTGGAEKARVAAEGIRKGMEFIPALIKDMKDGDEKAKAIADYRRLMGLNYAALCELELAYLEKDASKVEAATTSWKALKKEGHKKYEDE